MIIRLSLVRKAHAQFKDLVEIVIGDKGIGISTDKERKVSMYKNLLSPSDFSDLSNVVTEIMSSKKRVKLGAKN